MSAGGRSRAAALALLAGVMMVAGAAIVVPAALHWSKQGAAIRDARLKILRAEERTNSRADLVRTRERWTSFASDPIAGFSLAANAESAISQSVERVETVFANLNGSTSTVEGESVDSGREGVRKIMLEVRGTIPREGLGALLGALESTSPYIIIERFDSTSDAGDSLRISLSGAVFQLTGDAS